MIFDICAKGRRAFRCFGDELSLVNIGKGMLDLPPFLIAEKLLLSEHALIMPSPTAMLDVEHCESRSATSLETELDSLASRPLRELHACGTGRMGHQDHGVMIS